MRWADLSRRFSVQAKRPSLSLRLEHRLALALNLGRARRGHIRGGRQGRYVALDAAETLSLFTLEGWPEPRRFADCLGEVLTHARVAAGNPHSTVSVFGEMVALLWAEGKFEAALRARKVVE